MADPPSKLLSSNAIVRVVAAYGGGEDEGESKRGLKQSLCALLRKYIHLYRDGEMNIDELKERSRVVVSLLARGACQSKLATNTMLTLFLFDTGSNAHLTNCMNVFVPGSVRKCNVNVYGVSE